MMLRQEEIDILRADSKWNEGFYNNNINIRGQNLLSALFLFQRKKNKIS